MIEINESIARKVLETVDAGLTRGVGLPKPGKMCVEAAVCYAMGLPHGDNPSCVSPALRELKITLNDQSWPTNQARAKGLRRLAIAQLGSASTLDDSEFIKRVAEMTIRVIVPIALRSAAKTVSTQYKAALADAALRCESEGTKDAAKAANAAAKAAYAATYDANAAAYAANAANDATYDANDANVGVLTLFADKVVDILVEMKAPGVKWLALCD